MIFKEEFTTLDRIQLLQRWILVQSYIYYELDSNISSDSNYDANCNQLFALKAEHPDDWKASRYAKIFRKFEPGCTSGFELVDRVKKADRQLYKDIHVSAKVALFMRDKYASQ